VTTMPAPAGEHRDIEAYVAELDRKLRGSYRTKRDMLTEAHDSLIDATAAYQKAGLDPLDAERRAVAEFGDLAEIASGYQTELGLAQSRRTAWLVIATLVLQTVVWDNLLPALFSERPVAGGFLAESVDTSLEWLGGVLWAGRVHRVDRERNRVSLRAPGRAPGAHDPDVRSGRLRDPRARWRLDDSFEPGDLTDTVARDRRAAAGVRRPADCLDRALVATVLRGGATSCRTVIPACVRGPTLSSHRGSHSRR
jgi:hypothetical protein